MSSYSKRLTGALITVTDIVIDETNVVVNEKIKIPNLNNWYGDIIDNIVKVANKN